MFIFFLLCVLPIINAVKVSFAGSQIDIDGIIVFGDSLSDPGNAYTISSKTWPSSNYYWQGRFSNGPVWADYMQDYFAGFATLSNYATSASGVDTAALPQTFSERDNTCTVKQKVSIPGARQQWENAKNSFTPAQMSTKIFVLFTGGNDLIGGYNSTVFGAAYQKLVTDMVAGGVKNLVLVDLPLSSKNPIIGNSGNTASLIALGQQWLVNIKQLASEVSKSTGALIVTYDVSVYLETRYKTNSYLTGVTFLGPTVTDACFTYDNPPCAAPCTNPEARFWYDWKHPSTKVHEGLAQDFIKSIFNENYPRLLPSPKPQPQPEPSSSMSVVLSPFLCFLIFHSLF